MNSTEIAALLAKIQLDDNRDITAQVVIRWTEILAPVTAELSELLEAVNIHRRESAEYLQPVHILVNLRRLRDERHRGHTLDQLESKPATFVPDPKPDNMDALGAARNDSAAWKQETAIYRKQIAEFHAARAARLEERRKGWTA